MPVAVTNDYVIEKAIKDLLRDNNTPMNFKAIDVSHNISALSRPGLACAVISGEYSSMDNSGEFDEKPKIVVSLVIKNVANEEERRRLAHSAVRYVIGKLHKKKLGLDMEPLTVGNWREVTTAEHLAVACMVVEIEFTTQFTVVPEAAEENYRELLSICSTFKSETPDNETLAESEVIFNEVNNEPEQ